MTKPQDDATDKTLLVFNCHEPWVYQLSSLGYGLDIVVDLNGKYNRGWDERMRPLPAHARTVTLREALDSTRHYYCIITHNTPDLPGVEATRDWGHLKAILQAHRFYIHTTDPRLEDGFNMASGEAMAAGLPVLGNCHPSSPIKHGVSGFLSDDPQSLRRYAQMLLEDQTLARVMGQQARKTAEERFSPGRFRHAFLRSIEIARRKCYTRKVDPVSLPLNTMTALEAAL